LEEEFIFKEKMNGKVGSGRLKDGRPGKACKTSKVIVEPKSVWLKTKMQWEKG